MTQRLTSLSYGVAAGAGLVQLDAPPLAIIPIALVVGGASELYRGWDDE